MTDMSRARRNGLMTIVQKLGQSFRKFDSRYTKNDIALLRQYFDREYYLQQYPDVAASSIDPLRHYLELGWKEGRNPSREFSTTAYIQRYPGVDYGLNPFLHWLKNGRAECSSNSTYIYDVSLFRAYFEGFGEDLIQRVRERFNDKYYLVD